MDRSKRWLTIGLVALIVVLAAGGVWLVRAPLAGIFRDPASLHGALRRHGPWAPVVFMALQAAQVIVAPIPGHVLTLASGALFGPWRGAAYSALGVGVGTAIVLVLSRFVGRPWIRRVLPASATARVDGWATRHGPVFFFLFFMAPFLPDDLACFAVGLSPLPLLPMLGLIVLARLPGHIVSAWIGATARHLSWSGWVAILAPTMILLILYLRHRRRIEAWLVRRIESLDRRRESN
jgi:uncharacterized membrane protein YdjX (TVP38/TMEM64 family)